MESASGGCPSAVAIHSTPDSKEKRVRTISLARLARRWRRSGSPTRRASALVSSSGAPGATSNPLSPSVMNSPIAAARVETMARPWWAASISTLGRPSWSPSAAFLLAKANRSARARAANTAFCGWAPCQVQRSAMPSAAACAFSGSESSPAPTCSKRQWSAGGSLASASRRSSYPFFSTLRPIERMVTGSAASEPSRRGRGPRGGGRWPKSRP